MIGTKEIRTDHKIYFEDAGNMGGVGNNSIDLVVTSPPYPMIEMWDDIFISQNKEIENAFNDNNGKQAFEYMHQELDKVWSELYRVLKDGSIACINIGDATRTINGDFNLYSNHARIINHCTKLGFSVLPNILWRKQTNAPNKFMGSGMLPPGAYVTLEHEYIIILRKGRRRLFKNAEKSNRNESAFFWEERNKWFSDIWVDLKGINQTLGNGASRSRSAAYPFELAYRLINMFSVKGDLILDPFLGTGTTIFAAMSSERNSIGIEIDTGFSNSISEQFSTVVSYSNEYIKNRINKHIEFVSERKKNNKPLNYINENHRFPVMTRQELDIKLNKLKMMQKTDDTNYMVYYNSQPMEVHQYNQTALF